MSIRSKLWLLSFLIFLLPATVVLIVLTKERGEGAGAVPSHSLAQSSDLETGSHVVFVVALDGFRGDYLNPADSPNLHRRLAKAVFSRQMSPPFPSLTFPSHVTLATGRPVAGHGIPSNSFYVEELGEELRFPGDASLLLAEPIWTTAARQGLRVLSYDWPLSHSQTGPFSTTYFESRFDGALSDADRIGRALDLWESDPRRSSSDPPLRLITGYAKEADSAGHRHGPDAAETRQAVRKVDALVESTIQRAIKIFDSTRQGDAELFMIFVADHGMEEISHFVNIDRLLEPDLREKVVISTSGNLANIHLRNPASSEAMATLSAVDAALASAPFARVFTPESIPGRWSYPVEGRTGQRMIVLQAGYTFDRSGVRPVTPISPDRTLRGMHGYPPDEVPSMAGLLYILRHPTPLEHTGDLGPIDAKQLHVTIANILGIEPAEGSDPNPLW
jgi:predicted AlkP superfamily pyrophosphatase or phosphodiesterase